MKAREAGSSLDEEAEPPHSRFRVVCRNVAKSIRLRPILLSRSSAKPERIVADGEGDEDNDGAVEDDEQSDRDTQTNEAHLSAVAADIFPVEAQTAQAAQATHFPADVQSVEVAVFSPAGAAGFSSEAASFTAEFVNFPVRDEFSPAVSAVLPADSAVFPADFAVFPADFAVFPADLAVFRAGS